MHPGPRVKCHLLHPLAKPLSRATEGGIGYGLHACLEAPLVLRFGDAPRPISVGLTISGPAGLAALILPLGCPAQRGLVFGNTDGIWAAHRDAWCVSARLRRQTDGLTILPGDVIAQVVFVPDIPAIEAVDTPFIFPVFETSSAVAA